MIVFFRSRSGRLLAFPPVFAIARVGIRRARRDLSRRPDLGAAFSAPRETPPPRHSETRAMRALRLLVLALALALAPIHAHADRGNYLRCVAFAVPRGVPASHRRLSRRSLCAAHVLFDAFRDETRFGMFHARTPPATAWQRPRRPRDATSYLSRRRAPHARPPRDDVHD